MGRHFFSHEENEAYREGRNDRHNHRHNYERDRHSDDETDIAYFMGMTDEIEEEKRKEEERMLEEERETQERREYEKYLREQEFYDEDDNLMLDNDDIDELIDLLSSDIDEEFDDY